MKQFVCYPIGINMNIASRKMTVSCGTIYSIYFILFGESGGKSCNKGSNGRGNFFLLLLLLSLLFLPASLASYHPIRWSPMDVYIENALPHGPQGIEVLDANGLLVSRAEYSYTAAGKLHQEIYRDASGKLQGKTLYEYGNHGIVKEKLFNSSGKLLTWIQFLYNPQKQIESMQVWGANNKLQLKQRYRYKNRQLAGGVEDNGRQKEYFRFRYEKNRLTTLTVRDERQRIIAKIAYRYNAKGQLDQRIRFHDRQVSRCLYRYNTEGKIDSYTYYNQIGTTDEGKERWRKTKVLNFIYSDSPPVTQKPIEKRASLSSPDKAKASTSMPFNSDKGQPNRGLPKKRSAK